MIQVLPHVVAFLNLVSTTLLVMGLLAIRRGDRKLHPKLMLGSLGAGVLFLIVYVVQVSTAGHKHFPGDDWVRDLFLLILSTHTLLAIATVPLVITVLVHAFKSRFERHRKLARITAPIWLYVSLTGLVIYYMVNHLRPV